MVRFERPSFPFREGHCGGRDDIVNINPQRGQNWLNLQVDFAEGTISLIRPNETLMPLGEVGQEITTSGLLAGEHIEKACITFRIDAH